MNRPVRTSLGTFALAGVLAASGCSAAARSAAPTAVDPPATAVPTAPSTTSTSTTLPATTTPPTTSTPATTAPAITTPPTTAAPPPATSGSPPTPTDPAEGGDAASNEPPPPIEPPPPAPSVPLDDAQSQAFDAAVAAATVGRGDLAASVAVVRDGQVLHRAAFGWENPWTGAPATPDTRLRLASISKVLTASVLMQLAAEGAVQIDGPLLAQLGRSEAGDPRWASVTIASLLSHTSGIAKLQGIFFDEGASDWHDAAERILAGPLAWDPGTHFQYSNANFVLLGLLIEHVTGEPYEQAVNERIGAPLGGAGMRLAGTYDALAGQAMYAANPDRNFMEVLGPAGGWVATPTELARLVDTFDQEPPASPWQPVLPELAELMRQPQPTAAPSDMWNYGHGLMLFPDGSWGHTGTIEQTHTIVLHRPDDLTVALFVDGETPSDTARLALVIDVAVRAAEQAG